MKAGAAQPLLSARFMAATQRTAVSKTVVAGHTFVVMKGVFSPHFFGSTKIFTRALMGERLGHFLEIGCGTAATTCSLLLAGSATTAVCTDINPLAAANAKLNIRRYRLGSRAKVYRSDLFRAIPNQRFDAIYWNSPFINSRFMNLSTRLLERALYDPGYRKHIEFFDVARRYLSSSGFLYLGFGDFGDRLALQRIVRKFGWRLDRTWSSASEENAPVRFELLRYVLK